MTRLAALRDPQNLACLALVFCAFFLNLGAPPLFDLDEGAFSAATSEMLARGDFITTWLNGEPRFDKPILIYWLQALSVSLGGRDEFFFRLPSALAAAGWGAAIFCFARHYLGREQAYLSLAFFCASLTVVVIGRAATADALLNLLIALTMLDAWRFIASGRLACLRRAYLWIGLGLLTKGPVAAVVPLATLSLFALVRRDWQSWKAIVWQPWGWLIALVVATPWYVLEYRAQGDAFIQGFILEHNLGRFSDTMESHGGSLLYYLPVLLLMFLPFSAWLFPALARLRHWRQDPLETWCWCWFAFVFIFFSFSGTQLPHYILYGATPVFLLMAKYAYRLRSLWWAAIPAAILILLWLALPLILAEIGQVTDDPYIRRMLQDGVGHFSPTYYFALSAALLGVLVMPFLRIEHALRLQSTALLHLLVLSLFVLPAIATIKQAPVKDAAEVARYLNEPVVMWRHDMPSFSTYLNAVTPMRPPEPGELVFTRVGKFPEGSLNIIYAQGGVLLGRLEEGAEP